MFYNENWVFYKVGLTKLKNCLREIGRVIGYLWEILQKWFYSIFLYLDHYGFILNKKIILNIKKNYWNDF